MNIYSVVLVISALIAAFISVLTWRRRTAPGAIPLFLMLLTTIIWAGAYAVVLTAGDVTSRVFWFNIMIVGALGGTPAFFAFALQYTGRESWITPFTIILICIIPTIGVLLEWTNDWHHLFYAVRDFTTPLPNGRYHLVPGVGYEVFLGYSYPLVLFTIALIFQSFMRSPRLYRGQSGAVLAGTLIPLAGNIAYNLLTDGPENGAVDPTPILFTIMGAFLAYGLFSFRLFAIVPVARQMLVEHMTDGVLVVDAENRILDINPSAISQLQISGYSPIGMFLKQLPMSLPESVTQDRKMESFNIEGQLGDDPTHYYDFNVKRLPFRSRQSGGRLIVFRNITEKRDYQQALVTANQRLQSELAKNENLQDELRELAIRDVLTGLYNRRHLDAALKQEVQRAQRHQHPLSVLMIEIDSFKRINDNYGHEAGDLVLQKVAQQILGSLRSVDIACRFGGDEFVALLPATDIQFAQLCAERALNSMSDADLMFLNQPLPKITLSIGLAVFPQNGPSENLILRAADQAMYAAKRNGKNQVVRA